MISLGVSSADWNRLDTEEIYDLICDKTGPCPEESASAPVSGSKAHDEPWEEPIPEPVQSYRQEVPARGYTYKEYMESKVPTKRRIGPGAVLASVVLLCIVFAVNAGYRQRAKMIVPAADEKIFDAAAPQRVEYEFENCLYYDSMTEKERNIYQVYYDLVMHKDDADYSRKIFMPLSEFEEIEEQIDLVFYAMLRDHPEFFYISVSDSRLPMVESSADDEGILLEFRLGPAELNEDEMIAKFDNAVYNFMRSIDKNASASEIELQIHDKLNETVSYDRELLELGLYGPDLAHTAYGALVENSRGAKHRAVCDGYAQAYQYLLRQAGICAAQVTGKADTPEGTLWGDAYHAWNIVKLDDEWYEVDCCWDDLEIDKLQDFYLKREIKNLEDKYFYVTHHWFNRTTEEMKHLPASERTRFFIPGYESFNFIEETSHERWIRPDEDWYRSFEYLNDRLPIANGTKYGL